MFVCDCLLVCFGFVDSCLLFAVVFVCGFLLVFVRSAVCVLGCYILCLLLVCAFCGLF